MDTSQRERPLSQTAWNDFADRLKEIGERITSPTGARSGRERAEGYRYLVRMISAGHELAMEADRQHPELRPWVRPIRKLRGDGPDTLYHETRLDERLAYKLAVRRGDDIYFSATLYAYDADRGYTIVDHLMDETIVWQNVFGQQLADIYFSAERPEGVDNWIRLEGPKPLLFVLNDRQVERDEDGTFRIYACAENPGAPNWLSTQGYENGHILLRALLPETPMEAEFSVVKLAAIPTSG